MNKYNYCAQPTAMKTIFGWKHKQMSRFGTQSWEWIETFPENIIKT